MLPELRYLEYEELVGPAENEIRESWKSWERSELGIDCRYPLAGESRTKWFCYLQNANGAPIKENDQWLEYRPVLRECHD